MKVRPRHFVLLLTLLCAGCFEETVVLYVDGNRIERLSTTVTANEKEIADAIALAMAASNVNFERSFHNGAHSFKVQDEASYEKVLVSDCGLINHCFIAGTVTLEETFDGVDPEMVELGALNPPTLNLVFTFDRDVVVIDHNGDAHFSDEEGTTILFENYMRPDTTIPIRIEYQAGP